jgi:hypothetical protein
MLDVDTMRDTWGIVVVVCVRVCQLLGSIGAVVVANTTADAVCRRWSAATARERTNVQT